MTNEDWKRLASKVIARRIELGMTTTKALADKAKLTPRALGDIENGRRTNYTKGTKAQIEHALDWMYGSIDDIVAGYEPTVVTDASEPDETPDVTSYASDERSLTDFLTDYTDRAELPPVARVDYLIDVLTDSVRTTRNILIVTGNPVRAMYALTPAEMAIQFLQQGIEELKETNHDVEAATEQNAQGQADQDQEGLDQVKPRSASVADLIGADRKKPGEAHPS